MLILCLPFFFYFSKRLNISSIIGLNLILMADGGEQAGYIFVTLLTFCSAVTVPSCIFLLSISFTPLTMQ